MLRIIIRSEFEISFYVQKWPRNLRDPPSLCVLLRQPLKHCCWRSMSMKNDSTCIGIQSQPRLTNSGLSSSLKNVRGQWSIWKDQNMNFASFWHMKTCSKYLSSFPQKVRRTQQCPSWVKMTFKVHIHSLHSDLYSLNEMKIVKVFCILEEHSKCH